MSILHRVSSAKGFRGSSSFFEVQQPIDLCFRRVDRGVTTTVRGLGYLEWTSQHHSSQWAYCDVLLDMVVGIKEKGKRKDFPSASSLYS